MNTRWKINCIKEALFWHTHQTSPHQNHVRNHTSKTLSHSSVHSDFHIISWLEPLLFSNLEFFLLSQYNWRTISKAQRASAHALNVALPNTLCIQFPRHDLWCSREMIAFMQFQAVSVQKNKGTWPAHQRKVIHPEVCWFEKNEQPPRSEKNEQRPRSEKNEQRPRSEKNEQPPRSEKNEQRPCSEKNEQRPRSEKKRLKQQRWCLSRWNRKSSTNLIW